MSLDSARPASTSSVSSISLLEIKAETSLVLKAFLRQSLDLSPTDRPGRVGGAYKDHGKYSAQPVPRPRNGLHPHDDDPSSGDEPKKGLKGLFKRTVRRPAKDSAEPKDPSGSLEKDPQPKAAPGPAGRSLRGPSLLEVQDDAFSPSSTSEEDDGDQRLRKKTKKRNKLKKQLSELFRRKQQKDSPEKAEPRPQRPSKLSLSIKAPKEPLVSPNHPPQFYEDVAERLEQIAQRSHSIKKTKSHSLPAPRPAPPPLITLTVDPPAEPAVNKDEVVRQLIQVLSMEADGITAKIQSDPFLRSRLTRLSYPSFAKLLDAFSNCEVEQLPPALPAPLPASPTLRRVAVTMEVSRRVVTATGTQRMEGYAERYMETFAPWVKSHGGWENIVKFEEDSEFD